ncbi:uncharacterized protein [Cicer arietinum]|uniref:Uncharacterized protein LOC105851749 n=1 Tax=Cicer arietinum TaxID=3827 RepID=A0A1S3E1F1_CICAR|nr:uncharacterized protein LOC105851749 [Cicer arietinum]
MVISDGGSHFIAKHFEGMLKKYEVKHKIAIAYHPQTSGQVEVSNRAIKSILEKTVSASRKDLAIKVLNFNLKAADKKRKLQLDELDELRLDACENAKHYEERTKKWWSNPFQIHKVFPFGAVEILSEGTRVFTMTGQRLKHYVVGNPIEKQGHFPPPP